MYDVKGKKCVEDILCSLHTQTLGYRKWVFNAAFCIRIRSSSPRTGRRSYSSALEAKTRSQSLVPARDIAYTNITHIVIPLSLCEDHLFLQPVSFVRQQPCNISHPVSRSVIIFHSEKAAPETKSLICCRYFVLCISLCFQQCTKD